MSAFLKVGRGEYVLLSHCYNIAFLAITTEIFGLYRIATFYLVKTGPMTTTNRDNILQTALSLFSTRGYDAVGVQTIAVTANVTKPTLYHYFGCKKGILEAIILEYGNEFIEIIREAAFYSGDLSKTLTKLTLAYFKFAENNPVFYRLQLAIYFAPPESEPNQLIRCSNELQHQLLENLFQHAAMHHGSMQGRHLYFAATFLGTINTYIGLALNGYLKLNESIATRAVHQFMFGIYV